MPARVYSRNFVALATSTVGATVVVPAGGLYIVRDIDVVDASGSANSFVFEGSSSQVIWFQTYTPGGPTSSFEWRGRQVIEAGDSFRVFSGGGPWHMTVSGYSLTLP